jgi:flavodoxin
VSKGVIVKRILIAYFSETGNTKRIAEAIADEVRNGGHDVALAPVGDVDVDGLSGFDLIFVGSTCHSSDLADPAKALLNAIPVGAKAAGFITHATWMASDDPVRKEMHEKWAGRCPKTFETAAAEKGWSLVGYFNCMGAPSPGIEEFVHNTIITDDAQWTEYIDEARKHPTEEDLRNARAFACDALAAL